MVSSNYEKIVAVIKTGISFYFKDKENYHRKIMCYKILKNNLS